MARIDQLRQEFADIEKRLSAPEPPPPGERQKLARRHSELLPLIRVSDDLAKAQAELKEADALSADPEMRALAEAERERLGPLVKELQEKLKRELLPKDPRDSRNVFLEVRAGAGGDEAALFAAELLRMYQRFAQNRGWKADIWEITATGLKGVKQAVLFIQGQGAFSWLKWEGGVHRVQRVPETEGAGRIHTSTVTVAVLAEAEEVDIEINPKDLRVDTYRAGGAGGQNVNKVETAIRITHIPTNTVVQCQDERSQGQNRIKAMAILRSKLSAVAAERAAEQEASDRKRQVGSGDRSEKIRTYNFPQNRCTDHRLEQSWHNLPLLMEGEIAPVLEAMRKEEEESLLRNYG